MFVKYTAKSGTVCLCFRQTDYNKIKAYFVGVGIMCLINNMHAQ